MTTRLSRLMALHGITTRELAEATYSSLGAAEKWRDGTRIPQGAARSLALTFLAKRTGQQEGELSRVIPRVRKQVRNRRAKR